MKIKNVHGNVFNSAITRLMETLFKRQFKSGWIKTLFFLIKYKTFFCLCGVERNTIIYLRFFMFQFKQLKTV